jgi:hypothetical protein
VHRRERHRRSPETLFVECLREFVCSLLVDPFDKDVDIFGRPCPAGENGDVSRDVDVLDVELPENLGNLVVSSSS